MNFFSVASSNIAAVGYDDASQDMTVRFKTGAAYTYALVPRSVYDGMLSAESVGSYFAKHVRGKFESFKVQPANAEMRREQTMD